MSLNSVEFHHKIVHSKSVVSHQQFQSQSNHIFRRSDCHSQVFVSKVWRRHAGPCASLHVGEKCLKSHAGATASDHEHVVAVNDVDFFVSAENVWLNLAWHRVKKTSVKN